MEEEQLPKSQNCQEERHEDCPGYSWESFAHGLAIHCFCECHRDGQALPADRLRDE
jgi:hypothetical protein